MRLHLVDGTFELFRAEYANRPPRADPQGADVKATVGVVESMLTLLREREEAVTHLAVAFDNPIVSFRNDLFDGYKTDEGVPAHLRAQFDRVEEGVAALGVVVWSMDRFEADDAMATGATRFCDQVDQVRLLTPDKDLGQVLFDRKVVQLDRIRKKEITAATVLEVRGVSPASIPDYLALVGDTSDGIPGIPGFGAKGAAALLSAFGHLEAIPRDPAAWPKGLRGAARLAEALFARWEDALLYRKLATLIRDVPLAQTLEDLEWRGAPKRFAEWAQKIGAPDLTDRVPRWTGA